MIVMHAAMTKIVERLGGNGKVRSSWKGLVLRAAESASARLERTGSQSIGGTKDA
jgi:hypothetical protein